MQAFPGGKSPIGMMGAVFVEVNASAPACEGTAAERAAGIIALLVADNHVSSEKAA